MIKLYKGGCTTSRPLSSPVGCVAQLQVRFLCTACVPIVKLFVSGWLFLGGARTPGSSNFFRIPFTIRTGHSIVTTFSTAQPDVSLHICLVHLSNNARSSIETFLFFPGHLFSPAWRWKSSHFSFVARWTRIPAIFRHVQRQLPDCRSCLRISRDLRIQ